MGTITAVSVLALLGLGVGVAKGLTDRTYFATFWFVPMIVLSLLLPIRSPRYVFICLPFVFLLAGAGVGDLVDLYHRVLASLGQRRRFEVLRHTTGLLVAVFCSVAVLLSLFNGLSDIGPISARLFGTEIAHNQDDYNNADAYVLARMRPGDAVIAAAPGNLVAQGIGHPPTYWMAYYQKAVLLYVFEKHAQAVDTQYGVPVITDDERFAEAIDAHPRVWLVISDANVGRLTAPELVLLEARFRLVENGEDTSVYLATNYARGSAPSP